MVLAAFLWSASGLAQGLGTGQWSTDALPTFCSLNQTETAQYEFSGTLFPTQSMQIRWVRTDGNGNQLSNDFVMNVASLGPMITSLNFSVTFSPNSATISVLPDQDVNPQSQTVNIPADGRYEIEARIIQSSIWMATWPCFNPIFIQRGTPPDFRINGEDDHSIRLLDGCVPNIMLQSDNCGDSYYLSVKEVGQYTHAAIGPDAHRALTPQEVNAVVGTGLDIREFTGNGVTVEMEANKTYSIGLINTFLGEWKAKFKTVQLAPGTWDLIMRDSDDDKGFEPSFGSDEDLFMSQDIWNKRSNSVDPNSTVHETPDHVTIPGNTNKALVQITNIGCETSENYFLRMFWTRARAGELWENHWMARTTGPTANLITSALTGNPVIAGSEITMINPTINDPYNLSSVAASIPQIQPGQTWVMPFNDGKIWFPPNPAHFSANNGQMSSSLQRPIICLLARIGDPNWPSDPLTWEPNNGTSAYMAIDLNINLFVRRNNNVVTRNTLLYDDPAFLVNPGTGGWNYGYGTVQVDNTSGQDQIVDLCIEKLPDAVNDHFLNYGRIEVGVTEGLHNLWVASGGNMASMINPQPTAFALTNGTSGCLEDVRLPAGTSEVLGVRFNATGQTFPAQPTPMAYAINLYYEDGRHGGSNILHFTMPRRAPEFGREESREGEREGSKKKGEEALHPVNHLQVFPNPAKDILNIVLSNDRATSEETFDISLFNSKGELVRSENSLQTNAQEQINIDDLPAGLYFLKVTHGAEVSSYRFVKE